ncbi:MAG: 4-hydroxybenzoyl-CoA reductase subunit alpha, partial [Candidatus Bathyarchaeia archaeon]
MPSTHEKSDFTVLGKRHPRVDGVHKVTGRAIYVDDIKLPRMLYGKTLGSPYPHAEILNIDTGKAKQVPGVVAVITGKDIPRNHNIIGRTIADQSVLADDKVRFVGDEVAAVAAVSE